jgi:hypothetical protein
MAEFPAPSLAPARVHERARHLVGHHPCWLRRAYQGGLYSIEHFRICSYCGCINPTDLIELLLAGETRIEETGKPGKVLVITPNPIAGALVRMGSAPGPVFNRAYQPTSLRNRLKDPVRDGIPVQPTIGERLSGHFERPALEQAPALIRWPLYSEHISQRQWPEIEAAVTQGSTKCAIRHLST